MAHRKPKSRSSLQRRKPRRESYPRILIVCEGSKTEPDYFEEIIIEYKLSTTDIEIVSGIGTDPVNVVQTAIDLYTRDPDYDAVFAVFDRDNHENFHRAENIANNTGGDLDDKLYPIVSWPCFEYWILLHFKYTSKPYGGASPCTSLLSDLREHIPNYDKGAGNIFSKTQPHVNKAIGHAKQRIRDAKQVGSRNPSTKVYMLVDALRGLKDR